MEITFSASERELLLEILEAHHRELLREISRTKHHDFKQDLKKKEQMLESIVDKLEVYQPAEVLQPL